MVIFAPQVKAKRFIIALKIAFLLTLFGGATFYFQYVPMKKIVVAGKDQKSKSNCSQPLTEEETEGESETTSEEEQNDVRALHELKLALFEVSFSVISWATVHLPAFEEIHFEVITPPPQA